MHTCRFGYPFEGQPHLTLFYSWHIEIFYFNRRPAASLTTRLPDDKILALSKLKAFVDENFSMAQIVQILIDRLENIVGKGENTGNQLEVGIVR